MLLEKSLPIVNCERTGAVQHSESSSENYPGALLRCALSLHFGVIGGKRRLSCGPTISRVTLPGTASCCIVSWRVYEAIRLVAGCMKGDLELVMRLFGRDSAV